MSRRRAWLAAAALALSCAAHAASMPDETALRQGDDANGVDLPSIVGAIPAAVLAEAPPPRTTFAADAAARPARGAAESMPRLPGAGAASSVPEASETAMMAAGVLWLVGVAARRQSSERRRG